MVEQGMGRTRLSRLAAITVPAAAASLGLGLAIATGLVSATLSSADGFELGSTQASADNLALQLASANAATSVSDATGTDKEAALVSLKNGHLNGMCLAANQVLPKLVSGFFPNVGLKLTSTSPDVNVGDINLSAYSVDSGSSQLPPTDIGIASSQTGQTGGNSGNDGGFGLRTNATTTDHTAVQLNDMKASAYAITLTSGLSLSNMSIQVSTATQTCA
jgi:hypothetical protein